MTFDQTDQLVVNSIRALSIDAIEKANSGHPGLPMGAAPMAYTLWKEHLNFNPKSVKWFNRDRFILSAGHGSMLLYSLLHFADVISMDDVKEFRQYESRTPGHPEFKHTDGVEITTGPLGQGFAMSVGMAMAERHLAGLFNTDEHELVDHYTYVLASDGDLMEGISHEAASLAGHLALDKLIVLYDSNDISLDGDLDMSFSEDIEGRFKSYHWDYHRVDDGNDVDAINEAIKKAKESDQPSLIEIKTIIGYGSPNKQGKSDSHGAPLGEDERKSAFEHYELDHSKQFHVDESVYERFDETLTARGEKLEREWNELLEDYKEKYPEKYEKFINAVEGKLPVDYDMNLPEFEVGSKKATRGSSSDVIQQLSENIPTLFGGAADLASSNKTMVNKEEAFSKDNYSGRNIWFGVREFAMAAAANGMAAHGAILPYVGTFFVFSDYLKPAVRLSALMQLPVTYVFTHDSIAVGEDGPTHEPIEQLAGLRAIPNLNVIRPADGNETREAWKRAVESTDTPTALVLTRQDVEALDIEKDTLAEGVKRGGYVAYDNGDDAIVFATGSEVALAIEAAKVLKEKDINVKVVSIPDTETFFKQDKAYIDSVLNKHIENRTAVEMAASIGWARFVGLDGKYLTIDTFGASAPGNEVMERYGYTVDNLVNIILED